MAGVDYSKFGQPRPNTGIFRPPQYITPSLPSLPSPTEAASAYHSARSIAQPWWDAAGKYADGMPTKHVSTVGPPNTDAFPMNGGVGAVPTAYSDAPPQSRTPGYALPSDHGTWGASDSPFNNMRGAVSNMVEGLKNTFNGDPLGTKANHDAAVANAHPLFSGTSGGWFGGSSPAQAVVPPVGAGTAPPSSLGPGNPADASQGVVGYQPPPPNFMTGGGFSSGPAAPSGSGGSGNIPMPPPRPADLGQPAMAQAMAQDPSKIIMYGTTDNPQVGPNFDWRKLLGGS